MFSCKGNKADKVMAGLTEQEHPQQRHSPTVTEKGEQSSWDGNKGQRELVFARQVSANKEV